MAAPLEADTGVDLGINCDFLEHIGYKSTTYCAMRLHTVFLAGTKHSSPTRGLQGSSPRRQTSSCSLCQLQAHHYVCDEIASYIEDLVATCRERAQQHYQRLTRELTQGQLLRLGHQDSLIQQASFVLLKGELYVRGESEGDRLPVSGCDFHGVQSFLAVGRQAYFQEPVSQSKHAQKQTGLAVCEGNGPQSN